MKKYIAWYLLAGFLRVTMIGCGADTSVTGVGPEEVSDEVMEIKKEIVALPDGALAHLYKSLMVEALAGKDTSRLLLSSLIKNGALSVPKPTSADVAKAEAVKRKIRSRSQEEFDILFNMVSLEFSERLLNTPREETPPPKAEPSPEVERIKRVVENLPDGALYHLYASMLVDQLNIQNTDLLDLILTGGDPPSDDERVESVRVKADIDNLEEFEKEIIFSAVIKEFLGRIVRG